MYTCTDYITCIYTCDVYTVHCNQEQNHKDVQPNYVIELVCDVSD